MSDKKNLKKWFSIKNKLCFLRKMNWFLARKSDRFHQMFYLTKNRTNTIEKFYRVVNYLASSEMAVPEMENGNKINHIKLLSVNLLL